MKYTTVYFWWSASEVLSATFVKWQRRRNPRPLVANKRKTKLVKGKAKPGWWGIGTVIKSGLFDYPDAHRAARNSGLPPLHVWLAPHTELYATYEDARRHRNPLPKPNLQEYKVLQKWA